MGIFPYQVLFCVGLEPEEVVKVVEKEKRKLTDEEKSKISFTGNNGKTIMLDCDNYIVWIKEEYYDVYAHEFLHVIFFMMDHIQNPVNLHHNDETCAYLMSYLIKQAIEPKNFKTIK